MVFVKIEACGADENGFAHQSQLTAPLLMS